MAIAVLCSACEYDFKVDNAHAGKRIRCPSCKEAVRVKSPGKKKPAAAAAKKSTRKRPRTAEPTVAPRRKKRSSVAASKRRKAAGGASSKGLIIGGSIIGGAALAGVIGFMMMTSGDTDPLVVRNDVVTDAASVEPSADTAVDVNTTTDEGSQVPSTGQPSSNVSTTSNIATPNPASSADLSSSMTTGSNAAIPAVRTSTSPVQPTVSETTSPADSAMAAAVTSAPMANMSWADLNELVEPSVVKVNVTSSQGESNGSGFVADAAGLAVTNYHVVEGASEVVLVFANGDELKVTGYAHLDPKRDIAIVAFDPAKVSTPLRALPISLSQPRKGEEVAAFGAPFGLDFTFTQSSVSAIRSAEDLKEMIGLPNGEGTWIQHSAPISPGNSGGPLVNQQGEVVAINTLTLTIGQNLNFAISSGDIQDAISKKSTVALPVLASSAPPVDRGERSPRESGAMNPFEARRKDAIDLTGDERGQKLMAELEEVAILMLAFTIDRSGTVTGAMKRGARDAVERAKLKSRSFGAKTPVLLIAMALEPHGSKSVLRATSSLMILDPDNGDVLKLWEETDDIGTISMQSLVQGFLPPNLRRDITTYFGSLRSAMAKARRAHPSSK